MKYSFPYIKLKGLLTFFNLRITIKILNTYVMTKTKIYANIKFPSSIPVSFKEVFPNRLFLGFLKIYIIPKGKNMIGRKTKYCVTMNEVIAMIREIIEAIQITS